MFNFPVKRLAFLGEYFHLSHVMLSTLLTQPDQDTEKGSSKLQAQATYHLHS